MAIPSLEARLTAVEKDLLELKRTMTPVESKQGWIEKITGTFKDDPEFDEILRLGNELRKAEKMDTADGDA